MTDRTISNQTILDYLAFHPNELSGPEETNQEWLLGSVSIDKAHPYFRAGYSHQLPLAARFVKRWFESSSVRGWASIFRAFDPQSSNIGTPEYLLGWVAADREAILDGWHRFLNKEIEDRHRHPSNPLAKKKLILTCAFSEFGYDDNPNAPHLSAARGKRGAEHKEEVISYLNSGRYVVYSPGIERDVFDDKRLTDSLSLVTDGHFAWPKLIAYYVEQYDLELPEGFEKHMAANQWRVPDGIDVSALEL